MGPTPHLLWPLLPILVWVAVLVGLVWAIWRGVRGPRGASREPVCGACRYPVQGLSILKCPECGADLREAGIIAPRAGFGRSTLVLAMVGWTLLVPMLGLPPAVFFARVLRQVSYSVEHGYYPASGAYRRVDLTLRGAGGWSDGPPARRAEVVFTDLNGRTAQVRLRERDLHPAQPAPSAAPPAQTPSAPAPPADRFGLSHALTGLGVNAADPAVQSELQSLRLLIDSGAQSARAAALIAPGPALTQSNVGAITSDTPPDWYAATIMITGVVVWMLGLAVIVHARRSRMAALGVEIPRRRAKPETAPAVPASS